MLAAMKLSCCCTLVLLAITANTVALSLVDEEKANITIPGASSVSAADVGQETVTDEDVARFLENMKRLGSQVSFNSLSQSTTDPKRTPETYAEAVVTKFDVTILLAIGVASAVLLVALAASVVAIFVCCKSGKKGRKDMSLNSDLNRWDPQLLRPTKANMDAFIFGSPIPSFSEMIKQ